MENQKIDELLGKIKTLGNRVKEVRSEFGQPLVDRVGTRLDKLLTRLPQQDGDSKPQQPQLEVRRTCPKCGRSFNEDAVFCSDCGFSFRAAEIEERRRREKEAELERFSKMGVVP